MQNRTEARPPSGSKQARGEHRVSLKQVAESAGISVSAASHILGGRGGRYHPRTREHVIQKAAELGYRPNGFARAVRSGRFGAVSLLLSSNPIHSELFEPLTIGIHNTLLEHGMHLTLDLLSDDALTRPSFVPRFLRVRMVDGILIAYYHGFPERFESLLKKNQVPCVWLNSRHPEDCVYPDDFAGGRQATEHLLSRGFKRIAYVDYTVPILSDGMCAREKGYLAAMSAADLPPRIIRPSVNLAREKRVAHSEEWLKGRGAPDAVVCLSGSTAYPILHAAAGLGLRVPDDLAVITFAIQPMNLTGIHITSMQVPFYEIGRRAVDMLNRKLEDPGHAEPPEIVPFTMDLGSTT